MGPPQTAQIVKFSRFFGSWRLGLKNYKKMGLLELKSGKTVNFRDPGQTPAKPRKSVILGPPGRITKIHEFCTFWDPGQPWPDPLENRFGLENLTKKSTFKSDFLTVFYTF